MFNFITVHCGSANTVIEGIGWLGGLLEGNSCSGHPGVRGAYLVCYSEDGIKQFESQQAIMYNLPCADPSTSASTILKQDWRFSQDQHTVKVSSPTQSGIIEYAAIYNALGEKVMEKKVQSLHEYSTDIEFLESGFYVLRILCNGQPATFKFIRN
jgi:hypothetical protein